MIFRRSPNVPILNDYRAYRDTYLRPDFGYRCACCLTHDFSHLKNEYSNLYWTCGQCNLEKGNFWPSDTEYAEGFRFLDPCAEDHDDHWETHANGTLTAKTNVGRFTIKFIRLDRKRLNDLRRFLHVYQEKVAALEMELEQRELGPEQCAAMLAHLVDIKTLVSPPVFDR